MYFYEVQPWLNEGKMVKHGEVTFRKHGSDSIRLTSDNECIDYQTLTKLILFGTEWEVVKKVVPSVGTWKTEKDDLVAIYRVMDDGSVIGYNYNTGKFYNGEEEGNSIESLCYTFQH